ncbi:MAG TPA: hypothetical protein VLA73_05085 [Burkholderiales bacterium]|nr:hypothetical protein [Burkholderiales bacterium]
MVLRIVGVISLLIGLTLIAVAVQGLSSTASMIEKLGPMAASSGVAFDPLDWSAHWTAAQLVLGGVGALTLAGGVTLILKRAWGLLLVSAAAAVAAVFPWALKLIGAARYTFEVPDVVQSTILGAIAVIASLTYVFRGQLRLAPNNALEQTREG